jgi:L-ribulose-5-phosphate 3-epimerase
MQQQKKIAFNTANLVARFTNYRFDLANWGKQHDLTVQRTSAAEWAKICGEIREAGFEAVEVWVAHADPAIGEAGAKERRKIAEEHGLGLVAMAAGPQPENFRMCQWLEIDRINGGIGNCDLKSVETSARECGVRFNFENHAEKSAAELRDKIAGSSEHVGLCIDTGWLGTQGIDAAETIRALGRDLIRHVHVKDVRAPGGHATTPLGQGCVNVAAALGALKEIGYVDWYSWEDEPEGRNPFDTAVQDREWLEKRIG